MTIVSVIILAAFAFGAAFVQRTTGFGFGIFVMTALPFLLPSYGEATALSGLLAMVTSLVITMRYRRVIAWRALLPILATFLVVSYGAVHLVTLIGGHVLRRILGLTLVFAAVYFWRFSERVRLRPCLSTQVSLGSLSGLMGGLFGMQGPPAVLYFLSVARSKEAYAALAQCYFLVGNAVMTIYRYREGFLTPEVARSWLIGLPAVVVGTWVGGLVFDRLSLPRLRKVVYLYIAFSGIVALLR